MAAGIAKTDSTTKTGALRGVTRSSAAYDSLRGDILAGRRAPGSKLPFADLVKQYGCSIGSLREALQRLTEQGLVESEVQQGFRITPVSPEDLRDLTEARQEVEVLALRYAIRDGDVTWEGECVAALHVLDREPQFSPEDPGRFSERWALIHGQFHQTLLNGCHNHRILSIASSLRDSAELYRRWSAPIADRGRDIAGEHRALLNATVTREADLACQLMTAHIHRTTEKLLAALEKSGEVPPSA